MAGKGCPARGHKKSVVKPSEDEDEDPEDDSPPDDGPKPRSRR